SVCADRELWRDLDALAGTAVFAADSPAAHPHSLGESGDGWVARPCIGRGAGRTRCNAATTPSADRKHLCWRTVAAHTLGRFVDWCALPGHAVVGTEGRHALANDGLHLADPFTD